MKHWCMKILTIILSSLGVVVCTLHIHFLAKTRLPLFLHTRALDSSQSQMWVFRYLYLVYKSSKLSYKDATSLGHKLFVMHCSNPWATLSIKVGFLTSNHFTHHRMKISCIKGVSRTSWSQPSSIGINSN